MFLIKRNISTLLFSNTPLLLTFSATADYVILKDKERYDSLGL